MSKPKTRRTPDTGRDRKTAAKRSTTAQPLPSPSVAPSQEAASVAQALTQTFTAREFAALFDVSPDTVSRWCAGGMPHEVPGKANAGFRISLASACPWVVKYALEPPPESQRERLAREQADKVARENAIAEGQLVDAVQLDMVLQQLPVTLQQQLRTVTNRCSHEFAGIDDPIRIRERFEEEHRSVLEAMATLTNGLATACELAAQDAVAAAATSHAGAVG